MKRSKLLVVGMGLALVALFAGPAAAQDGPSLSVEPSSVDAAGETEFTITGAGWTAAPPIFVLPCAFPEGGDAAGLDSGTCDTGNLTPATPDGDGNFEVVVTFDVPEEGLGIGAGDAGQTEAAAAVVTVGAAAEEGGDEAAEGEAEGEEMAEGEGEEMAEDGETEEAAESLPETGAETAMLVIVGLSAMVLGAMVVGLGRRFNV